jgi:biopolymer transport protein ExbD
MRFRKYAEYVYGIQPIVIAPFVNILFLVFIFCGLCLGYMMASSSGISVQLPRAITSELVQAPAVQISVFADGTLAVNKQRLTIQELEVFLKQITARHQTIVINADRQASWENVIRVWDVVRACGMAGSTIAANP